MSELQEHDRPILAVSSFIRRLNGLRSRRSASSPTLSSHSSTHPSLPARLLDVFLRTWDLGFTAFGGPPVHFQILHRRFVAGINGGEVWADEQTFQELFAICQALPGPGSTKMLFCLTLLHAGFIPAVFVFFVWSLPGAIGMYALSLGIQNLRTILPSPLYALLSGLNASTVAIIALAAVQLATKAITDKFTRILVIGGATAGLCYNALWYFPVLMTVGGAGAVLWYIWGVRSVRGWRQWRQRRSAEGNGSAVLELGEIREPSNINIAPAPSEVVQRKTVAAETIESVERQNGNDSPAAVMSANNGVNRTAAHIISIRTGIIFTVLFFATFITTLVLRSQINPSPRPLDLFANMYLAGTVIFGGGPVVIPLLRSYTVDPGWVSGRDFLLGLALIQAFPGPNFNFAVCLGALSLQNSGYHTFLGALLGYIGIFVPGLTLAVTVQGFWRVVRRHRWVVLLLQGVNAAAVGLVFTAVYRLWEIGYVMPQAIDGKSLASEPWWVVIATITYAEAAWFSVPPAAAILSGGVLGLLWYAAIGRDFRRNISASLLARMYVINRPERDHKGCARSMVQRVGRSPYDACGHSCRQPMNDGTTFYHER